MGYYDRKALSLLAQASRERLLKEHDLGRIRYTVLPSAAGEVVERVEWGTLGVRKATD